MSLPFTSLIPKPKDGGQFNKILNVVFYVSFGFVLLSLAVFFLLNNSANKANKFLEEQQKILLSQRTAEQLELEKSILGYQKKFKDFNSLFAFHRYPSNIFAFLEELTHPKVLFTEAAVNFQSLKFDLSGESANFQTLAEQILVFKEEENIKKIGVQNLFLNTEGKTVFNVELDINPKVFSFHEEK